MPPGAEGLIFLPYLSGERAPYPDPLARGAFIGLTVRHGLGHMVRAVLEGVAFRLRDVFELVSATAPDPLRELRSSGGGTNSPLWRQIIADVLGVPLSLTRTSEGVATGGAILAAVGAGWFDTVGEACEAMVEVTDTTEPGPERRCLRRGLRRSTARSTPSSRTPSPPSPRSRPRPAKACICDRSPGIGAATASLPGHRSAAGERQHTTVVTAYGRLPADDRQGMRGRATRRQLRGARPADEAR